MEHATRTTPDALTSGLQPSALIPPPSISVVAPVYNAESTIGNMLSALLNQSGVAKSTEYIIVDNGSTDRTIDVIQKFPVTLLHESTRGPAAARNCGLRAATGDIIVHLDADTQPTRRWLAEIVAPFNDPAVMLVGGRTLAFEPQNTIEHYFTQVHLFDAHSNVQRNLVPFTASMNMAVRRSAALAIGGWDESMITTEDVDFCYRLMQKYPAPIFYAERAVLLHRNRSTLEAMQRQAWSYGEGLAKFYEKYPQVHHWTLRQAIRVRRNLIVFALWPYLIRASRWLGQASTEAVEFARYHYIWNKTYWAGFHSFRRSGEFRSMPKDFK